MSHFGIKDLCPVCLTDTLIDLKRLYKLNHIAVPSLNYLNLGHESLQMSLSEYSFLPNPENSLPGHHLQKWLKWNILQVAPLGLKKPIHSVSHGHQMLRPNLDKYWISIHELCCTRGLPRSECLVLSAEHKC